MCSCVLKCNYQLYQHIHMPNKPSASYIADSFIPMWFPMHYCCQWRSYLDCVLIYDARIFRNNALASRLAYTVTRRNWAVELCFWCSIDVVAPLVWTYKIEEKTELTAKKTKKKPLKDKSKIKRKKYSKNNTRASISKQAQSAKEKITI